MAALQPYGCGVVVEAATIVAPKVFTTSWFLRYTSVKPLGDRVLVKIKSSAKKTVGGILLPTAAQSKHQGAGKQVVYSKFPGKELEFDGSNHLLLKKDDILGILDTGDVKDLKPLNDRVIIKVAEAQEKTAGVSLLTEATKKQPFFGWNSECCRPWSIGCGGQQHSIGHYLGEYNVMYRKFAGKEFKSSDGADHIVFESIRCDGHPFFLARLLMRVSA